MSADLNGKAVGRSRGGLSPASEDFTKDKCLFFFLRSLRLFNCQCADAAHRRECFMNKRSLPR